MADKSEVIWIIGYMVVGLAGIYYGFSQFVEPYIQREQPKSAISAPTQDIEPVKWDDYKFRFRALEAME